MEKLAVSIAAIGGWKKELTHQMYACIRAGNTNKEISAEVGARLERIIGKLNEELEAPAPEAAERNQANARAHVAETYDLSEPAIENDPAG